MAIWNIAYKNIKTMSRNIPLFLFLVVMPIFQIYLIDGVFNNAAKQIESNGMQQNFIEIVTLSKTTNSSFVQTFSAGVMVQFLLITSIISASVVVSEKYNNTLMRIFVSPLSKLQILTGILIGHTIINFLVSIVIIGITYFGFNIDWGNSWFDIFMVTLVGVYTVSAFSFLISGIFKNPKITGTVMSVIVIMMTFLSGCYNPEKANFISNFTINKWIYESYVKLMEGFSLKDITLNLTILIITGTIFMVVASIIYRRENIYE